MPNRIIREGWLDSAKIGLLTAGAERFFLRLCLRADDFGRFHGNPTILRNMLFPSCDNVTSKDVIRWVAECKDAALILFYRVKDSEYVEIPNFNQRTRALVSKFPANDGQTTDICQTDDGHPRTYSYSSAKSETTAGALSEDEWLASLKSDPANAGIDVQAQADKARFWCKNNSRQFTRRMFVNWLIKADRAINGPSAGKPKRSQAEIDAEQARLAKSFENMRPIGGREL